MISPAGRDSIGFQFMDEYPSPTEKEKLSSQILKLKSLLSSPTPNLLRARALIKLSDLLVGRNSEGDYLEASRLYEEVLSSTTPEEPENTMALLGKAELKLQSADPVEIEEATNLTRAAVKMLGGDQSDFFYGKAKVLLAELFLKRGGVSDRDQALEIYKQMSADLNVHEYFKLRAVVGKVELLNYFFRKTLLDDADTYIKECESVLSKFKDERRNDYFRLKGQIVLSELKLIKDKGNKDAKTVLEDVANNESAGDDLRARASLDLAEVSSPSLAATLIKGVRKMDGIDPYLLRKARAIEDSLKSI
jgi:hypothetical protein